jgi:propanediol dehydratase small subunit
MRDLREFHRFKYSRARLYEQQVAKVRTMIERMKLAVATHSLFQGEAQLTEYFDDQMMHMMAGARRTRARLTEELEAARLCGDADRQLMCSYYITEADGLMSLISHVMEATPARVPAEVS